MKCNDFGEGDIIKLIIGAVGALFTIYVVFFYLLPEISKAFGSSISPWMYLLGIFLILAVIAAVIIAILKGRGSG